MTKYISLFFCLVMFFSFFSTSCTSPKLSEKSYTIPYSDISKASRSVEASSDIKLAAGDTLTVSVWGLEDLTKKITLDATGNIYYPFIGKIKASGLTIEQLQAIMKEKLSRYYTTPDLTITPQDLAGQQYYVLGEVNGPGKFNIKAQTTVLEAISSAGGLNRDAGETVLLLRKQEDNLLISGMPVQYSELTKDNISSVTMRIRAGDILYMAPSKIANIEKFMTRLNNILNPLLSLERGIIFWPELINAIDGSSGQQELVVPLQ